MNYKEYLIKKKELYELILQFISNDNIEDDYQINDIFENQKILENREDVILFIRMLVQISNNHHRLPCFFAKIEKILQYFYSYIKQAFTNLETFKLFKSNKLLVLHLIERKIITINDIIAKEILYRSEKTNSKYHLFFYPEIKEFLETQEQKGSIERELKSINENIFTDFENNRKKGENELYVCELIRNDSIENFIVYVNQTNLSLSNTIIKTSIFETNSFLIKNEPTLIEYAAFFGAIQIFQFLKMNYVELRPSLWLYAIHSKNAELIHLLEENLVEPPYKKYIYCFNESVKCHHNEIANYFEEVYSIKKNKINLKCILQSYNFQQISSVINDNSIFFYLCHYNYSELVNIIIQPDINKYNEIDLLGDSINIIANRKDIKVLYVLLLLSGKSNIDETFKNQSLLHQIAIPPNITEIGMNCFCGCSSLTQISIPTSVTKIGVFAFYNCTKLTKITIPSSVTIIDQNAFNECSKLTRITIPLSVTFIGEGAFEACTSLKQFLIPPFVTTIEKNTFNGCKKMEKVFIPSSVNYIDEYAFHGCISLKEIKLPPNITKINKYSFESCESLKQITIPPSVTTIEYSAFGYCLSLSQVSIPSSVKTVDDYAFDSCYLLDDFKSNSMEEMMGISVQLGMIVIFISIFISIGLFANFIVTIIWWSRLHPWFAHGYKSGKNVYVALLTNWISVICFVFYIIFYLLIFFIWHKYHNRTFIQRKRQFFIKLKYRFNISTIVILILFVLVSWISSIVASAYSLKTEKINGESIKCLRYMFDGYKDASDWVLNQSLKKQYDLKKWYSKMISKAYGKNGKATNYYCLSVGLPVLLFTIIPIAIILYCTIMFFVFNR